MTNAETDDAVRLAIEEAREALARWAGTIMRGPNDLERDAFHAGYRARVVPAPQLSGDLVGETLRVLGAARELVAELDDMPKDEALGKAMWSSLDQIDSLRKRLAAVPAPAALLQSESQPEGDDRLMPASNDARDLPTNREGSS